MPGSSPRGFFAEENGAIAPTFAIGLFVLIGMAGISFDYARLATLDTEFQTAADQAALAAASQLDGRANAMTRATNAASNLVSNKTIFGDNGGTAVTIATTAFYQSYDSAADTFGADATTDAEASVVKVAINARKAFYALTPVIGLFNSGDINAEAIAGLGSSICKVPPLMICNPNEANNTTFPTPSDRGKGILLEAGGGGGTWGPGNYGYLDFGGGAKDLEQSLGANGSVEDCLNQADLKTKTGNNAAVTRGLNTRFDIYDNGLTAYCAAGNGNCSPAQNVTKDVIHLAFGNGPDQSNNCRVDGGGDPWVLPSIGYTGQSATPLPTSMGLPRDACHATSTTGSCGGGRFGDGGWNRALYFSVNHPGVAVSIAQAWAGRATEGELSRYDVYRWEIATSRLADRAAESRQRLNGQGKPIGQALPHYSFPSPKCAASVAPNTSQKDRRLLTAAVVNCTADNVQGATTLKNIVNWVDLFYVEPSISRTYAGVTYTRPDQIYVEVVGVAERPGGGTAFQYYQRQQPRLLK